MNSSPISQIADHVKADMEAVCSAHDFFHIQRVLRTAQVIAEKEWPCNILVIQAAALLHEYFDEKFWDTNSLAHRESVLTIFLESIGVSNDDCIQILYIIHHVWFGKSLQRSKDFQLTSEFMIVEDADRLDAIGAIAIARTFAYGGKKGSPIYDPAIKPRNLSNDIEYRSNENTTLNHFWEKLLLLKDMMHTPTGKKLATKRHEYMQGFLDQFLAEREGNDCT